MKNRIWIVPNNDLEAKSIIQMLRRNGEEYLVTGQAWGASWGNLETEIFRKLIENGVKINSDTLEKVEVLDSKIEEFTGYLKELAYGSEERKKVEEQINKDKQSRKELIHEILLEIKKVLDEQGCKIYGVELCESSEGLENIDHHTYGEDDRSNPKSSIEQVAEILGVELTLDEQFVSENDKGYIPAMEKLGAELGLSAEVLQKIIANIRMRDRQMQSVTLEQEEQAEEAVSMLGNIEGKRDYIQLDLPHSKTSTVTDRLFGKYDNLLVTSADGETNFFRND